MRARSWMLRALFPAALGSTVLLAVVAWRLRHGPPATPLSAAARQGDLAAIDRIVRAGANVDEAGERRDWPPVIHAIHGGQTAAVARLLEHGASLEAPIGTKAIQMASGYGDAEMLDLLLSRGAKVPEDAPAAASLMAAAVGGAWDLDHRWTGCGGHTAVVRTLLERDPDLRVFANPMSPTSPSRFAANLEGRLARWYARGKGCHELLRLIAE